MRNTIALGEATALGASPDLLLQQMGAKANTILEFVDGLRGEVPVTFEEGTWS